MELRLDRAWDGGGISGERHSGTTFVFLSLPVRAAEFPGAIVIGFQCREKCFFRGNLPQW